MKALSELPAVYLYPKAVDFRKSINGLAMLVQQDTALPLSSGALFVFTNKGRDKIKALYWDTTGFALWYKCLENQTFPWPKHAHTVLTITSEQLTALLSGLSIVRHAPVTVPDLL